WTRKEFPHWPEPTSAKCGQMWSTGAPVPESETRNANRWSAHMAVAAGFLAGNGVLLQLRDNGFEIFDEQGDALGFGAHAQQRLLEIEVGGKRTGEAKRKRRVVASSNVGIAPEQRDHLAV